MRKRKAIRLMVVALEEVPQLVLARLSWELVVRHRVTKQRATS